MKHKEERTLTKIAFDLAHRKCYIGVLPIICVACNDAPQYVTSVWVERAKSVIVVSCLRKMVS